MARSPARHICPRNFFDRRLFCTRFGGVDKHLNAGKSVQLQFENGAPFSFSSPASFWPTAAADAGAGRRRQGETVPLETEMRSFVRETPSARRPSSGATAPGA